MAYEMTVDNVENNNPFANNYALGKAVKSIEWAKGISTLFEKGVVTQVLFPTDNFTSQDLKEDLDVYLELTKKAPRLPILSYAKEVTGGDFDGIAYFLGHFLKCTSAFGVVVHQSKWVAGVTNTMMSSWKIFYPSKVERNFHASSSVEGATNYVKKRIKIPSAEVVNDFKDEDKKLTWLYIKEMSNEDIAKELGISSKTVGNRLTDIKKTLGNPTRAELFFIIYFGRFSGLDFDYYEDIFSIDYINRKYPVKGK